MLARLRSVKPNWYSESNAVKSVIESECFAYVEDKLCVATSECLERTDDGKIRLTEYAKTHEEECFLQFIVDEKDGTLHYVKLPKSKADEAFNYNDAITEDLLSQYGLVNEMSKEMLNAIDGEEFGPALDILMDKHICNYTARLLRSITGLDNRTISNMKKGENLTKSNVISACLGIHIPFRVSNHMLSLADLTLNMTSKGQVGDDNETYDMLLHLKWTTDYGRISCVCHRLNLAFRLAFCLSNFLRGFEGVDSGFFENFLNFLFDWCLMPF